MSIADVQAALAGSLENTPLTSNSWYGIGCAVVILFFLFRMFKHTTSSVAGLISFIFLAEVGHIVAFQSDLGIQYPVLQQIFKYDILTALAQLCVGTKAADVLLWIQAYITSLVDVVISTVKGLLNYVPTKGVT